jgi:hypothetical protein
MFDMAGAFCGLVTEPENARCKLANCALPIMKLTRPFLVSLFRFCSFFFCCPATGRGIVKLRLRKSCHSLTACF